VQLRLTDAQAHKLFFIEENGTWSLILRPPARSGDSPENIKDAQTIASEGLSAGVFAKASGGQQ
jgi:hypothetical protein